MARIAFCSCILMLLVGGAGKAAAEALFVAHIGSQRSLDDARTLLDAVAPHELALCDEIAKGDGALASGTRGGRPALPGGPLHLFDCTVKRSRGHAKHGGGVLCGGLF